MLRSFSGSDLGLLRLRVPFGNPKRAPSKLESPKNSTRVKPTRRRGTLTKSCSNYKIAEMHTQHCRTPIGTAPTNSKHKVAAPTARRRRSYTTLKYIGLIASALLLCA